MRRLLVHLAVALVAFVVGVKLTWAFAALFGPALKSEDVRPVYVAPPVVKMRSCPTKSLTVEIPAPPAPPAAPAAPKETRQRRVVIRRSDGTVEVIETRKESRPKGDF
jgi:hypothetical protein